MSKQNITEKEIIKLLQEKELERPSKEFTNKLIREIEEVKLVRDLPESGLERYLGKSVVGFLLTVSFWYLYELDVYSANPLAFVSIAFLILGVWGSVWLVKTSIIRKDLSL